MPSIALDALISGSAWFWLVFGLILVIAEILAPVFWLLWPGLAALAVGLITSVTGPFDWRVQGVIFAALALIATIAGRRYVAKTKAPPEARTLNSRAQQYHGRHVRVHETFAQGAGHVAIDDTIWRAVSVDGTNPVTGDTVEITGVEGALLRVKAIRLPAVNDGSAASP